MKPFRAARGFASLLAAALAMPAPIWAADIALVLNHYSVERFVPHIALNGPVIEGDAQSLEALLDMVAECAPGALPAEGGNCAVITLSSPGGNYIEGLKLARLLRERAVTSVVEAGARCYSACAFAFLGGSGFSSQDGVGAYNDRIVEPGGILGFHAPYFASDDLGTMVAQYGMDKVLGASRDDIALMVQRLVDWNVDSNILAYAVSMGPDETYDVTTGEDYYLTRSHLPPSPLGHWISDAPSAIRNACLRLMAYHKNGFLDGDAVGTEFMGDLAQNEFGETLSGFRIGPDNPLGVTFCALPTQQADLRGNVDLALYTAPGISGAARPLVTLFHRPDGWSTLGTGAQADRRIFKKGGFNAMFTAPFTGISDPEGDAADYIAFQKFANFNAAVLSDGELPRPQSELPLTHLDAHPGSDLLSYFDQRIVVQIGNALLLQTAQEQLKNRAVNFDLISESETGFVYGGTYASGRPFVWFSLFVPEQSLVALVEIEARTVPDARAASVDEQYAVACSLSFLGESLICQ